METKIFDPATTMPLWGTQIFDGRAYNDLLRKQMGQGFRFDPVVTDIESRFEKARILSDGKFRYASTLVQPGEAIPMLGTDFWSYAVFDKPIMLPTLMGTDNKEVWMSLTPMEMMTQRFGLQKAKGTIMVAGCGLGWFARRCIEKAEVDYMVIVDDDPDVFEAFGEEIVNDYPGQVKLFCADAYDYAIKHAGVYDSVLFDIWRGWGEAERDEQFTVVESACAESGTDNVWGWGRDWQEVELLCEAMQKQTKAKASEA